jgi:hypothetical protein
MTTALLLMLSLFVLGVVYGLWSKMLLIEGTIHTGEVDAHWVPFVEPNIVLCNDNEPYISDPKDVGEIEGLIDESDPQILHFTIYKGYPLYKAECQVEYKNVGTIPLKVEAISFLPGPELQNCTIVQDPSTGSFEASCDELTVKWANSLCIQLDPGGLEVGSSLRAQIEQPAEPDSTYTFDVELLLVQWNESTCP